MKKAMTSMEKYENAGTTKKKTWKGMEEVWKR